MDLTSAKATSTGNAEGAAATGVNAMAKLGAAGNWCGAYSWDSTNNKCYLNKNQNKATQDGANAGKCYVCDDAKTDGTGVNANATKAMGTLQAAVATAWADVAPASNTAGNALQGAIDTALAGQSAVVTAWMDAWYEQQYWAAVKTDLAAGQADKAWQDRYVELSKTSPANATTNPTTMAVISAASAASLTAAQTNLTTLTATKTTADALVASLKLRIEDSTKEIKALLALSDGKSTASAASTAAGAGVLDARYATARAAW